MENIKNGLGSSETTREASLFDFRDFYKYGQSPHVPRISEAFLEWFIGFYEEDGSICFRQRPERLRQKARFELTLQIVQKEKKILDIIQKTFGFGYLCFNKRTSGEIVWKWAVGSKKDLERIAFLFSGNLILPKRQRPFLEWLKVGHSTNLFLNVSLEKPWTSKVSLKDGWLSGFIDAEGCFYAKYLPSKSLNSKLGIEQKMVIS